MRILFKIRNFWHWLWLKIFIIWHRFKLFKFTFDKGEMVVFTLFILMIGCGLGYAWRLKQMEPNVIREIEYIQKRNSEISKDIVTLEVRLGILEGKNKRFSSHR